MSSLNLKPFYNKKIAVGLSGGVDSSTLIALLKEAGATVTGLTMKLWKDDAYEGLEASQTSGNSGEEANKNISEACYGPGAKKGTASIQKLCANLGAEYAVIDLSEEYEEYVLNYFREEYLAGRTPNPCVKCNETIKFGFFIEKARKLGFDFDYFATGHYARIEKRNGLSMLRMAVDKTKDQSYFIHRLTPSLLNTIIFPFGEMHKTRVREEAKRLGLKIADKAESQDFVSGGYDILFSEQKPGDIVDEAGKVLGKHKGIIHYTIGQRRGIGVSAGPEAVYVSAIDPAKNRIIVSPNSSLFCSDIIGQNCIIHDPMVNLYGFEAFVRIRQNHRPAKAKIRVLGQEARIEFAEAQRAAAPGQSCVFYDEEGFVLGGCIIEATERSDKDSAYL